MKTIQVTYFQASDGTRFNTPAECEAYESEAAVVKEIMRDWPKWPSGETYIQLGREYAYGVRRKLFALVLKKYGDSYPQWKQHSADDVHPFSAVGRVLSESNSPLAKAWQLLGAVNFDNCRMYEQPFFAMHPRDSRNFQEVPQ